MEKQAFFSEVDVPLGYTCLQNSDGVCFEAFFMTKMLTLEIFGIRDSLALSHIISAALFCVISGRFGHERSASTLMERK